MILRNLLKDAALELTNNHLIKDVRIGLCYTAVQLDNGQVGLAYTFRDSLAGGCTVLDSRQKLAGKPAKELIQLFDSENLIASALALATANALFNVPNQHYQVGSALDQLCLNSEDSVAMVGNFTPLIKELEPRVKQLRIFERQANPEQQVLPIATAEELLPQCQVALITATAIINNSIDHLLELTAPCREVVILGSSTPLAHKIFEDTPVTLLCGALIKDTNEVLRIVSEGGGTPAFKETLEKVNLITQ